MALRDVLELCDFDHGPSVRRLKHPADAGLATSSSDRPATLQHVQLEVQLPPIEHGPRRAESLITPLHHQPVGAQCLLLRGVGVHLLLVQIALVLPPEAVAKR